MFDCIGRFVTGWQHSSKTQPDDHTATLNSTPGFLPSTQLILATQSQVHALHPLHCGALGLVVKPRSSSVGKHSTSAAKDFQLVENPEKRLWPDSAQRHLLGSLNQPRPDNFPPLPTLQL